MIVANNVLAHVPDINDFILGMKIYLNKKGVISVEFQHLLNILNKNQFDTIYHEHYSYLSLISAQKLFLRHKLEIYDVEQIPTHGGSLRIYVKHKEDKSKKITKNLTRVLILEKKYGLNKLKVYSEFQKKVEKLILSFLRFLKKERKKNKSFIAYGAAAKGNTFINYLNLDSTDIKYIIDRNPIKIGKYLPGSKIKVVHEKILKKFIPDYIIIIPWNLKKEIMYQLHYIKKQKTKFITAIPKLKIY